MRKTTILSSNEFSTSWTDTSHGFQEMPSVQFQTKAEKTGHIKNE
jgi:hypothetical protein